MIRPSNCPPWRPDSPPCCCYTTPRDTIRCRDHDTFARARLNRKRRYVEGSIFILVWASWAMKLGEIENDLVRICVVLIEDELCAGENLKEETDEENEIWWIAAMDHVKAVTTPDFE